MELSELRRLVREGEHGQLEFKRKANHPDKIARELVAFANTHGGLLLIGVDDDGKIYGSKTPNEDIYAIESYISAHIYPELPYTIEKVSVNARREVIIFDVMEGHRKPFALKDDEGKKYSFVRIRDMSLRASYEMRQYLRLQHKPKGVNITFGDKEQQLLQILEELPHITLDETRSRLRLSRRKASNLLILMARAGLLYIQPTRKGDYFMLIKEAFE